LKTRETLTITLSTTLLFVAARAAGDALAAEDARRQLAKIWGAADRVFLERANERFEWRN
jgi:hypothetical protein